MNKDQYFSEPFLGRARAVRKEILQDLSRFARIKGLSDRPDRLDLEEEIPLKASLREHPLETHRPPVIHNCAPSLPAGPIPDV